MRFGCRHREVCSCASFLTCARICTLHEVPCGRHRYYRNRSENETRPKYRPRVSVRTPLPLPFLASFGCFFAVFLFLTHRVLRHFFFNAPLLLELTLIRGVRTFFSRPSLSLSLRPPFSASSVSPHTPTRVLCWARCWGGGVDTASIACVRAFLRTTTLHDVALPLRDLQPFRIPSYSPHRAEVRHQSCYSLSRMRRRSPIYPTCIVAERSSMVTVRIRTA